MKKKKNTITNVEAPKVCIYTYDADKIFMMSVNGINFWLELTHIFFVFLLRQKYRNKTAVCNTMYNQNNSNWSYYMLSMRVLFIMKPKKNVQTLLFFCHVKWKFLAI